MPYFGDMLEFGREKDAGNWLDTYRLARDGNGGGPGLA